MAVPTFHAIVVVDIEDFGPRMNPRQSSRRRAMQEACDQVTGDKIVGSR